MLSDLLDLDATAVVRRSERNALALREQEVDDLRLVLAWADLHSEEPTTRSRGGNRLIQLGGDGTPLVQELCWGELAIARLTSLAATKRAAADALDLRHRMPLLWTLVQDLRLPVWVARKVAAMARNLTKDTVALVDTAVAEAVDQSPGRILRIAEAKVIEADLDAHRARLTQEATNLGVHVARPRTGTTVDPVDGEPGSLRVTCKLPPGIALDFDAAVDELATAIEERLSPQQREHLTRGQLQAQAVELLSHPHAAAAFLNGEVTSEDQDDASADGPEPKKMKKRAAVIYLSLTDAVLAGAADGVARVEGIGPMLLEQLTELLRHREITVQPVIDLNDARSVNAYEHPTLVKHRTLLRMLGDVFPHSANTGFRRLDHDHPTPYVSIDLGGPPGQTSDHNDAPLTRTHHRTKTHQPGYLLRQLGLGVYEWTTPHGLKRLVTPSGTRRCLLVQTTDGTIADLYFPDAA
jgi:hypothetical protein